MNNSRKSLWLVTGGAGFIGSNISEELVRRGMRVRILDNFSTGKRSHIASFVDKVELIEGDIRDLDTVRRAMEGVDFVSHQGALRSVPKSVDRPTETNEVNVAGTLNVLIAAKEAKVKRLVYASSSSIYGDGKKFPQREDQYPRPISPYAASKLAGECYAVLFTKTFGLETVSLRYFNVYGPRQDPESLYSAVIPRFMDQARRGEPLEIHWDGKQSRDFTYVADVVSANLLAAEAKGAAGQVLNVANGKSYSLLQLIKTIEKIQGRPVEKRFNPKRPGDVRRTWADVARMKKVLKWKPVFAFEEGLKRTWEYFNQESGMAVTR